MRYIHEGFSPSVYINYIPPSVPCILYIFPIGFRVRLSSSIAKSKVEVQFYLDKQESKQAQIEKAKSKDLSVIRLQCKVLPDNLNYSSFRNVRMY